MHNQIQELRGNVRVYARLRPFLPSDKAAAGALPCIEVNHHDDSMAIRKVVGEGNVLESHRFGFDKCFAPSTGQDAVFEEVRPPAFDQVAICRMPDVCIGYFVGHRCRSLCSRRWTGTTCASFLTDRPVPARPIPCRASDRVSFTTHNADLSSSQ
jgi:hypothetical protein